VGREEDDLSSTSTNKKGRSLNAGRADDDKCANDIAASSTNTRKKVRTKDKKASSIQSKSKSRQVLISFDHSLLLCNISYDSLLIMWVIRAAEYTPTRT